MNAPPYAPCLFCGEPRTPDHACDGRQGVVEAAADVILGPHFDGETYDSERDHARLTGQLRRVADVVLDGQWRTYSEIEAITGDPPQSISARLRDLRKKKFGLFTVERRIRDHARSRGLWEYRVVGCGASNHFNPNDPAHCNACFREGERRLGVVRDAVKV